MYKSIYYFLSICTIIAFTFTSASAQYDKEVIVHSGEEAPGTDGAYFDDARFFEGISLDEEGDAMFHAYLELDIGGVTTDDDEGIWLYENGEVKLLARKGSRVIGLPDYFYLKGRSLKGFFGTNNRRAGIDAYISFTGEPHPSEVHAFFADTSISDNSTDFGFPVLHAGMDILGINQIAEFETLAFNGEYILFSAVFFGPDITSSNDAGICVIEISTGEINILARKGDPMPILEDGFTYYQHSNFNGNNPMTWTGNSMFQFNGRRIANGDVIGGVFSWNPGGLVEAFVVSPIDSTLLVFSQGYRMNEDDEIAGVGVAEWPGISHIWYFDRFDEYRSIIQEGDVTPGLPGDTITDFEEYVLFDNHSIAFQAETLLGNSGIWIWDETGTSIVAAIGDQAPGMPENYNFWRVNNMIANPAGEVAFADIAVEPNTFDEYAGIWAGNKNGLRLVCAQDDSLELEEDFYKDIFNFFLPAIDQTRTGRDGHASTFNELGQLTFTTVFYDGTNALVLAKPTMVVNITNDNEDDDVTDGVCDTGGPLVDGRPPCSLRAAMQEANSKPGHNDITFDIPMNTGTDIPTILLNSTLPLIIEGVNIDASTQEAGRVVISGQGLTNGCFEIGNNSSFTEISGFIINNIAGDAIYITNSSSNIISDNYIGTDQSGMNAVGNIGDGIWIDGESFETVIEFNVISGNDIGIYCRGVLDSPTHTSSFIRFNKIGTNKEGTSSIPNASSGIYLDGVANNSINDNLISGNDGHGIFINNVDTIGNFIDRNYIGTDVSGNEAIANKMHGIYLLASSDHVINDNLISGNEGDGIYIDGTSPILLPELILPKNNIISNNKIGAAINRDNRNNIPNMNGITIDSSEDNTIMNNEIRANRSTGISLIHADGNEIIENHIGARYYLGAIPHDQIGGVFLDRCRENVLMDNTFYHNNWGILIFSGRFNEMHGNRIGGGKYGIIVDDVSEFNEIKETEIFETSIQGIDLNFDGVTLNDGLDADQGANHLQNFPELIDVQLSSDRITVIGTVESEPTSIFGDIEFFYSTFPQASGYGAGAHYVRTFPLFYDNEGHGHAEFEHDLLFHWFGDADPPRPGGYITATARDEDGNTSEFSHHFKIVIPDAISDVWVSISDSLLVRSASSANIEYRIQYGNNGPDDAVGNLLTCILPEYGSFVDTLNDADTNTAILENIRYFLLPILISGESGEVVVEAIVDTNQGIVCTQATIETASTDIVLTNNADTVYTNLDSFAVTSTLDNVFNDGLILKQNYPNPFHEKTTISYSIPDRTTISLLVFDPFGRRVRTLIDNIPTDRGDYNFEFIAAGLSSGIYFYVIRARHFNQVKKMIFID